MVGRHHADRLRGRTPARLPVARHRPARRGVRRSDLHAGAPRADDGRRTQRRDAPRRDPSVDGAAARALPARSAARVVGDALVRRDDPVDGRSERDPGPRLPGSTGADAAPRGGAGLAPSAARRARSGAPSRSWPASGGWCRSSCSADMHPPSSTSSSPPTTRPATPAGCRPLRGTTHWVAFFPGGGSAGWVGGYELASSARPPGHDRPGGRSRAARAGAVGPLVAPGPRCPRSSSA